MMMMLSTETELSKTSAGVHRFLDLHLRFVFQIDIARHRDLAKGSFPDSSPSKIKKHRNLSIYKLLSQMFCRN